MSAWRDFVTASLLGTDKGGALPAIPAALQEALGPADGLEREARFLTHAGALAWWRRAGWKPERSEAALPAVAAPEASGPLVSAASVGHLRAMLSGHCAEVLPEWLGVVVEQQRLLPPEWLPALLDRARQNRALRPLVMTAGGNRMRWLAGQNADWNFAADDSPEHWETGNREQRLAILRGWRTENPALAREKLESVWSTEPADGRAAFLMLMEEGLGEGDAAFLEHALDDRSKEVRQGAVDLLARLPGSALAARMLLRAAPLIIFKRGGLLTRASLEVKLPDATDDSARRDGLDPKALGMQTAFGEKAALLVLILAATPLSHWTSSSHQSPAALLKALEKNDFSRAVATGWTRAALRQQDPDWAEAILDAPVEVQPPSGVANIRSLYRLLPEAARANRLSAAIRTGMFARPESWPNVEALLLSFRGYLPVPAARDLVDALRRLVAAGGVPWQLRNLLGSLATKIPPTLFPFAIDDWPTEQNHAADFVELLTFRRDALAALAQP